jgi:antitoxin HicB
MTVQLPLNECGRVSLPKKITKIEMAIKMQTSQLQLDRLLNPEKTGVSIDAIQRAASVVGRQLRIELI